MASDTGPNCLPARHWEPNAPRTPEGADSAPREEPHNATRESGPLHLTRDDRSAAGVQRGGRVHRRQSREGTGEQDRLHRRLGRLHLRRAGGAGEPRGQRVACARRGDGISGADVHARRHRLPGGVLGSDQGRLRAGSDQYPADLERLRPPAARLAGANRGGERCAARPVWAGARGSASRRAGCGCRRRGTRKHARADRSRLRRPHGCDGKGRTRRPVGSVGRY